MNKKAIIIDGNSLIYRAFYATLNQLEYYKKNNLQPVNAIKLVTLIVTKLLNENNYDYALFALDHHKKTFRNDEFNEYKANRKSMPEDLLIQLNEINFILNILGVKTMSVPGIEADDIIGSFCDLMNKNNVEVHVFSSDKDMLQLVNQQTTVSLFKTGISERQIFSNFSFSDNFFGLNPKQIPDFKGIAGDSSDNLCGIKGIGKQTAINLLLKYGSFENIYQNLNDLSEKQRQKFLENKEHGILCKKLATIKCDALMNYNCQDFILQKIKFDELSKIINKYHFKGFDNLFKK